MASMTSVLWLRQEAFHFVEAARAWPDEHVRRRLHHLAEECRVLSMEMEAHMSRANAAAPPPTLRRRGERTSAFERH